MRGCDVPEDREAVEVHTYDASQFQDFHPESLAVGEAVWAFLEKAAKVGYGNGNGFSVCGCGSGSQGFFLNPDPDTDPVFCGPFLHSWARI
jgi:hypothetical protein